MSIDKLTSGNYRVRIYHRGRVIKTATFKRMRDAKEFELAEQTAIANGTFRSKQEQLINVEELLRKWRKTKSSSSGKYLQNVDWAINSYLVPAFGDRKLAQIRSSDLQIWFSELESEKSPATARIVFNPLRQAFKMAVRDDLVKQSPCDFVKIQTAKPGRKRALTREEIDLVVEALPGDRDKLMVKLAARSGLRWGELTALQWKHLSPNGILVEQAVGLGANRRPQIKSTKSGERRFVPLPPAIIAELNEWRPEKSKTEDLIFKSQSGSFIDRSNWVDRTLRPACNKSGVEPFTPHALRDSYASLLGREGIGIVAVSHLLGHTDPAVTLRHYQDYFPEDLTNAVAALHNSLDAPPSQDSHEK